MSLCLPAARRDGRRDPRPTNQKLPLSLGVTSYSVNARTRRGRHVCVCVSESERKQYKEVILAEWHGHTDIKRKGFNGRGLHLFGLDGERVRETD